MSKATFEFFCCMQAFVESHGWFGFFPETRNDATLHERTSYLGDGLHDSSEAAL